MKQHIVRVECEGVCVRAGKRKPGSLAAASPPAGWAAGTGSRAGLLQLLDWQHPFAAEKLGLILRGDAFALLGDTC